MTVDAAGAIANYRPISVGAEVVTFARAAALTCAPKSPKRARALLFAAGRLGSFAISVGLPLDEGLFTTSVIERFVAVGCSAMSPATRRTLRTNLRFVARRVLLTGPPPAPLSREHAKIPYSDAEIASYLALGDAQPTQLRQKRSSALIALGAGAGLVGSELRYVRGEDVFARSGGVVVTVTGRRARSVPVRAEFGDRLLEAAEFFGPRFVVSGPNPNSHNVTSPLISSLSGGTDLARLVPARLRATYLVALAEAIGLRAFMDAAGITCSQRLGDLVALCSPASETEAVALLGGRR